MSEKTKINAKIIADSLNVATKDRLTSFIVEFPRFILAEFNTHRMLSKNGASSRAIPLVKAIERVQNDPFIPEYIGKNQPGMQANEELQGVDREEFIRIWLESRDLAVQQAKKFEVLGAHKQLSSRILEPFLWMRMIVSGTEWQNFFALRAHTDAQPEFKQLAYCILEEYNKSEPQKLKINDWHVPFGESFDEERLLNVYYKTGDAFGVEELKRKISVARCARVSLWNFEGKDDYEADIKLCDKLFGAIPRHLSPTEHVAQATNTGFIGNFKGFTQMRKFYQDENLTDPRVIKKV